MISVQQPRTIKKTDQHAVVFRVLIGKEENGNG